ncbi:hypothetical protein [Polyangium jinanense]|uniref:Uncharacterized protein n=1 Tax=Polyangium jinanense TaxID=2829994 RepID=A0A9X3X5T6_9BACT|nr:hypothetical protein [Polyangium jinanense]MDC3983130.1 hypothetical protein [Polyangium jinanense]
MVTEKSCFVIAPIGDTDSETRKRSDQVLKHVIRPAVAHCGYKAVRADEIDKPGIITSQVIQHVVNDPLVVADLTERNPNVFYELAIRHALRKPLVQLIRKGDAIPFDVAGTRTIYVDHRDLDSVEHAKNEIIDQVRALEKDPSALETPISVSLDLQILRQSEKPEERSLADVVATVVDLRTSISKMEARIGTKDQEGILDEIKASIHALPRRIDDHIEAPRLGPWRRGRIHPMMLHDLLHAGASTSPAMGFLLIASIFRDWMPWLHELGIEIYRLARQGKFAEMRDAVVEFRRLMDISLHGPMSRDLISRSKETAMLAEEAELLLNRTLSMLETERAPARERVRKETLDLKSTRDV